MCFCLYGFICVYMSVDQTQNRGENALIPRNLHEVLSFTLSWCFEPGEKSPEETKMCEQGSEQEKDKDKNKGLERVRNSIMKQRETE